MTGTGRGIENTGFAKGPYSLLFIITREKRTHTCSMAEKVHDWNLNYLSKRYNFTFYHHAWKKTNV